MLMFILTLCFLAGFSFILGIFPLDWEARPTLRGTGLEVLSRRKIPNPLKVIIQTLALINRPLCSGVVRARLIKDLGTAHVNMSPEEFFLVKEMAIVGLLFVTYPMIRADMMMFWLLMSISVGYMLPEYWLKGKIKRVKIMIAKELPDTIDLLGLCVNAGLDFILALKWVVEKSPPTVIVTELNTLLQEINVGKTRRDALKDLSLKYELPDLSSFTRTLIQADKMGTSVSEALNVLSEDMRIARFRRGEQQAMKAPLKLLIPLLFCIFPVVGILVAGPIFLEFIETNPLQQLGK